MKGRYYFDERGEFTIPEFEKVKDNLRNKKMQTGDWDFTPDSENITHQQRKYFYGLLAKLIKERFYELGNDEVTIKDTVHFLKDNFLFYEKICPITGKYIKVHYSLGDNDDGLPREIFSEKKELIQKFGAEKLDINLPDPDPNWKMFKKENP
jgi:hypothetical protein